MLFIHKLSSTPIDPWIALRHGGVNNLGGGVRGKYLILWNVDIVQRGGAWHYIFEFDVRDSLQKGALAQLASKNASCPDDMDWQHWLGPDWRVISAAERGEILSMPGGEAHKNAVITDMRPVTGSRPIPVREPGERFQVELPPDFLLGLPD